MEGKNRCQGIHTGTGYLAGARYKGLTEELDSLVCQAARMLQALFGVGVAIRFNSDRRSGGVYLADGGIGVQADSSVGISVDLCSMGPTQMSTEERPQLARGGRGRLGGQPGVKFSTCLKSEFLKEKSEYILMDTEFRSAASLAEAVEWIKNGTNAKQQEYVAEIRSMAVQDGAGLGPESRRGRQMDFWGSAAKRKRLEKELTETKKLLREEKRKASDLTEENQKAEILLWRQENKQKELDFRKHRVRDQLKHEFWEKISPVFFLEGKKLRTACEQGSVYYKSSTGQWVAVDSYCVICGNEVETKTFHEESDALRYAAIRQMLGIPSQYTTCPRCYQNYLDECA